MAKSNASEMLTSLDSLFTTQEQRDEAKRDSVQDIPISQISDFPEHPFKVKQDEAMLEMAESVRQYGVLVPGLVRQLEDGSYQMVSGHRRKLASELAGRDTIPCIVRDLTDDEAVIIMVDSNLQRENILPSERAFAYKMKLEAIKNQGARSDLTSAQIGPKLTAAEKVAEEASDTKSQVKRFIRLTNLVPELLDMVDEKKIAFNPAVELSYLDEAQQRDFLEAMNDTQNAPSLSQAQRLKKLAQEGHFSYDVAFAVMGEEKKTSWTRWSSKTTPCGNISRAATPRNRWRTPSSSCWNSGSANSRGRTNADLYRNERPDEVFFFCNQKEKRL